MKPKTLKPTTPATKDIIIAKKAISQIFYQTIFYPILKALGVDGHDIKLNNADDPIIQKIQSGKITYTGNEFAGEFDSRTSKAIKSIGGVFDKRKHTYKILESNLPTGVRTAVAVQRVNNIVKRKRVLKTIEEINIKFLDSGADNLRENYLLAFARLKRRYSPTLQETVRDEQKWFITTQ